MFPLPSERIALVVSDHTSAVQRLYVPYIFVQGMVRAEAVGRRSRRGEALCCGALGRCCRRRAEDPALLSEARLEPLFIESRWRFELPMQAALLVEPTRPFDQGQHLPGVGDLM